jgi:diguanylate cyclase (GGDEF)-like protein
MTSDFSARPTVLVVDPDPAMRRLLRLGLEVDGARVLESSSAEQARRLLADEQGARTVYGVVVAGDLPEGGAATVCNDVDRLLPDVPVVVTMGADEDVTTRGARVVEGDVEAVITALHLPAEVAEPVVPAAVELLEGDVTGVVAAWLELCQWDPLLGPDVEPPVPDAIVRAVVDAMRRPQPLGWGPDPEVERVAEAFAMSVTSVEAAVGQFVCLREALRRRLGGAVPPGEEAETFDRLNMIIDRAIGVAVSRIAQRLETQVYIDPLTGLLNRRALDRDIRREVGRATRHRRRFTLVLADLDGLKVVNDRDGHAAGDARLQALAVAVERSLRVGDAAYRIGGDEFVVLLTETTEGSTDTALARVIQAGAPPFTWGAATFPDDGSDVHELLAAADARMLTRKTSR